MKTGECGATLVEVMVVCVVLMVIAVAGGAYVAQSSGTLALHRNRAVAVAMANSRMEEIRAQSYSILTNDWMRGNSTFVTNNPYTKLETCGTALGLSNAWSAIQITVQVTNRAPDYVSLMTIVSSE